MKLKYYYSYMNGYEYIMAHAPTLWDEIKESIELIDLSQLKPKISKEKNRKGKSLLAPIEINKHFEKNMRKNNWISKENHYLVTSDPATNNILKEENMPTQVSIVKKKKIDAYPSSNTTNFIKDKISINLQLGKYAFVHFDIYNHISNYFNNEIKLGIIIVPTKKMSSKMSSGPTFYEKNLHEIQRCKGNYPGIPMILGGIE